MFNAHSNSHYKTLKGWSKSAEYNRIKLQEISSPDEKVDAAGVYKVRMERQESWQLMKQLPGTGVSEWLYLNSSGLPIYYWSKNQTGLTII